MVALLKQIKVLTKLQQICLTEFLISCFTVSVTQSINTPKSSNDFLMLIISFISSFKINKVKLFPALTAIFLLNLFIVFEVKSLTDPGKLSLAEGTEIFVSYIFFS